MGSYYNIPKAIFYLLKGEYSLLALAVRVSSLGHFGFWVQGVQPPSGTRTRDPKYGPEKRQEP